ncbi:ABC transporter ATP-binding protein [Acidisphaera sp. L21]|uniref:ABC transporter ATP-binding protein n=1 Tax=Acidisphaera sp. L21 TaxID=1641851 RepID=UPI00131E4A39|nr:ABC transporter ATP-binding protein [Acidisphaera sp. L21]
MLTWFERILRPTAPPPPGEPPDGLLAFYWHFVRQSRALVIALFATGMLTALIDSLIPVFLGRVVSLVSHLQPAELWAQAHWQLMGMAAVMLVGRPAGMLMLNLVTNQAIAPGMTNLVRWQSHWHVVRQSWTFFQNDFAGRIANRVMQVGPALRESIVATTNAVWYIVVYGGSAMLLLSQADPVLAAPIALWFACYAALLRFFVPRARDRSRRMSEARSGLTGRVVDSYTNILTVKLFARARDEDAHVQSAVDEHTATFRHQLRLITLFTFSLHALNACMVVGTGALSVFLWTQGSISVGTVAMALPLAWQLSNISGWVSQNVTSIFENVGVVQDGMRSISVPRQQPDAPDARDLVVSQGAIRFEHLRFGYGTERGVLHGVDLTIRPGERIGLVGTSGAGKSTLVNLLLGFYTPEAGRITIDGQDIAQVTQESLRGQIGMVTQDTSLLHRSISDNIRYGRPEASQDDVVAAAERAHADGFIRTLEDWNGRRGYDAHVGERGVKLSGGQRQRVAIARVILKNAPILVLDEATSALDSEVENAIQEQLDGLMEGRTVIAIAHRLSTLARMDRIVVLDRGQVVEQGTHAALLVADGAYARLWQRQSGGFRTAQHAEAE